MHDDNKMKTNVTEKKIVSYLASIQGIFVYLFISVTLTTDINENMGP